MKVFLVIIAPLLLGGCGITTSTGNLRYYPSEETAVFTCYMLAYQYMPLFIYPPDDKVPKRAILYVNLRDERIAKSVLNHKARLRVSPRHLKLSSSLNRDLLTIRAHNKDTQQWWTLKFRRDSDGMFNLVSREGDFRN